MAKTVRHHRKSKSRCSHKKATRHTRRHGGALASLPDNSIQVKFYAPPRSSTTSTFFISEIGCVSPFEGKQFGKFIGQYDLDRIKLKGKITLQHNPNAISMFARTDVGNLNDTIEFELIRKNLGGIIKQYNYAIRVTKLIPGNANKKSIFQRFIKPDGRGKKSLKRGNDSFVIHGDYLPHSNDVFKGARTIDNAPGCPANKVSGGFSKDAWTESTKGVTNTINTSTQQTRADVAGGIFNRVVVPLNKGTFTGNSGGDNQQMRALTNSGVTGGIKSAT